MTVTDIIEASKSRYKIYIDDEFAFVLYQGELRKFKIKKGAEIQETCYQELMQEILPKRAKLRAMNLLAKRPYTEARLRAKLTEGLYPPACIEQAVSYVKSFGYIDDDAYAKDYILYHREKESRRQIEQKLMQKGIERQTISRCLQETWDEQTETYEFEQVKRIFQKKYHGIIPEEPAQKNKMMQFFMRKGYTMSTVQEVLDEMSLGNLHNYN